MAAPKTKTSMMTLFNRKPDIIRRYGTMKCFYDAAQPYVAGSVPANLTAFSQIIDNQPCTPEAAKAVEQAITELIDRPREIIHKLVEKLESSGEMETTVTISELACLQAALRATDEKPGIFE